MFLDKAMNLFYPFTSRSSKSQVPKALQQHQRQHRTSSWLAGMALASATTMVGLIAGPSAQAQTRNYSPRFKVQARGRTTIFGNAVTSCRDGDSANYGGGNIVTCADARNATVSPPTANNDFFIDYVDIDSNGTTFNSSSSTYTFPTANPGFDIVWAGLYWTGNTSAGTSGVAAPTPALRNQMLFQVPGGAGYQTVTASQVDTSGSAYSAFADVTSQVQAGTGTGEYFGANIQTGTGGDRYGGWTLIVVYADDSEVLRNMTIFDGYLRVFNNTVDTTISGFLTPTAGPFEAAFGAFSSEGDVRFQPDNFLMNGTLVQDATNPFDNFFNSSNSLYGTGITTNTTVAIPGGQTLGPISRNPAYPNLLALDIDIVEARDTNGDPIIPNGATSVDLRFTSNGDAYFPTAFFFSVQVFQPVLDQNFTKTVTDINGGDVNPGDILEYTITYQNTGNDNATDVVLRDDIPTNTTYEPDSLQIITDPDPLLTTPATPTDAPGDDRAEFDSTNDRVVFRSGIGADLTDGGVVPFDDPNIPGTVDDTVSVKFRVRVDSGITTFPTTISNQADIDYNGQFSGTPFSGVSDDPTTSDLSDPTDIDVVEPQDPNLILIKRITRINGVPTNGAVNLDVYVDDDNSPYDDNVDETPPFAGQPDPNQDDTTNWPDADSLNGPDDYLKGVIDAGEVKPGDEIEYTIYFLSTGGIPASSVELCDRIPDSQTFVPDAFNAETAAPNGGVGASRGILVDYNNSALAYTNDADGDTAQFYLTGAALPDSCNVPPAQSEDNGAIVVDLGTLPQATSPGTPSTSYGAVRFRAKVR